MPRYLLLLLCCLTGLQLPAREFPSVNFTQANGLTGNAVYDIYQDDDGYIWFATNNGVSRFNGIRFENFTIADGLPDNECFFFRKDYYGRLWIATFNGELVFYKDHVFHSAKNTPFLKIPSFKRGNTGNIVVEPDSSLTFFFQNRQYAISVFKDRIKRYELKELFSNSKNGAPVNIVKKGPDRFQLVFPEYALYIDTGCNLLYRQALSPEVIQKGPLFVFLPDRNESYYFSKNYIFDQTLKPLFPTPLNGQLYTSSINKVKQFNGVFFICTNHGLYSGNERFFENLNITTVFKDRDSNYWVGTIGNGVFKMKPEFYSCDKITDAYRSPVVFAGMAGQNLLFVTRDRSVHIHRNGLPFYSYDTKKEESLKKGDFKSGNIISGNNLLNAHQQYPYLLRNIQSGRPPVETALEIPFHNVNKLYEQDGYFYAFGRNHIDRIRKDLLLKPGHRHHKMLQPVHPLGQHPVADRIYGSAQAPDSTIFFSGLESVFSLKDSTVIPQPQFGQIVFKEMVISGSVLIGCTYNNRLIIATHYADKSISLDSSVNNDCVWDKFYILNDTAVLITTNDYYRVISFHKKEGKIRYTLRIVENQSVPLLADYIFADSTNCYFFKDKCVIKIPVATVFIKDPAPSVVFTGLKTNTSNYSAGNAITLSFKESRSIHITYRLLSFNTPNVSTEYTLSSGDQATGSWISSDGQDIDLLSIEPGTYTIKIRARTYAGSYSNTGEMVFIVRKPFWQTLWFLLPAAALLTGFTWWGIRYFIRKKIRHKEKEIRFIKSEYRALNALMNPHFIFNSLNSVQGLINRDDKQSASEYVRTISDLIRQNMYNISGDFISLEKELNLVANYLKLEKLRFKDQLNYQIIIDDCIEADLIMIPPLLIQPLVENALKYGILASDREDGFVSINLYCEDTITCIDVTDNGDGLRLQNSNDTDHQSSALENIKRRLYHLFLLHHKKITLSVTEITEHGTVTGVRSQVRIHN